MGGGLAGGRSVALRRAAPVWPLCFRRTPLGENARTKAMPRALNTCIEAVQALDCYLALLSSLAGANATKISPNCPASREDSHEISGLGEWIAGCRAGADEATRLPIERLAWSRRVRIFQVDEQLQRHRPNRMVGSQPAWSLIDQRGRLPTI